MTQESVEQRKCENCGEFGKCCMEAESQEPIATVASTHEYQAIITWRGTPMPHGSVLYTHPPKHTKVVFPTMLRKMWSGSEVQEWLDENVNKEKS